MRRRALLLGVAALALGGAASAQVPEIYGQPIYGRVSSSVTTWTEQEILDGFGRSKGGMFEGSGVSRVLGKAGRVVKWGGMYVAGPLLLNEALNWLMNSAQESVSPALKNWWNGVPSGYPPFVNPWGRTSTEISLVCQKLRPDGTPLSVWVHKDPNFSYRAAQSFFSSEGVPGGSGLNSDGTYQGAVKAATDYCASLLPPNRQTLDEAYRNNPEIAAEIRDALKRFLDAHPQKAISIVSPTPNINETEDDVIDTGLDTDGDGSTDGDEARRGPGVITSPGNRPHEGDGPATDPSDPMSKPTDTDGDGIPDWRDSDDDNDGTPDNDEPTSPSDCQKSRTCNPDSERDTDGDGTPNRTDPDDDNDGFTDQEEEEAGTDPEDPESKPEEDEDEDQCGPGQVRGADGKCAPEEDEEKCPEGYIKNSDTGKCEEEPEGPKDPVPDECGDLSFKRFTAHTGHFLRDVVFPCDDVGDILKPITDRLSAKFPFSLAASLNGWFQAPTGGGSSSELPSSLGIIPLDWGWLAPLWAIIKNIVGVALWAWFIYWLIDRFTPRAHI